MRLWPTFLIALSAFGVALLNVGSTASAPTFISFTEGNPGTPGDGVLVDSGSDGLFGLTNVIALGGISDGLSATVFLPLGESDLSNIGFTVVSHQSGSCYVQFGAGAGWPTSETIYNGRVGIYTYIPQELVNSWVDAANQYSPGCNFNRSQLFLSNLGLPKRKLGDQVTQVDAVAIDAGPNQQPSQSSACKAPSGLDLCQLRAGDILLERGCDSVSLFLGLGTYFTHSALYMGNGMIAEAANYYADHSLEVRKYPMTSTSFSSGYCLKDWAVVRPGIPDYNKAVAMQYASEKSDEAGVTFDLFATKDDVKKFYCSKFVWKSYLTAGFDVADHNGSIFLSFWVTPDDLYVYSGSSVVQSKGSSQKTAISIHSPAHLTLVDSSGRRSGYDPASGGALDEIPGALYSGPDAQVENVSISDVTDGWRLVVTGFAQGQYDLTAESIDAGHQSEQTIIKDTSSGTVDEFAFSTSGSGGAVLGPTPSASAIPTETATPTPTPTTETPTATPGPPQLGDINCDDKIDGADVAGVLKHAATGFSLGDCEVNGDVNRDGKIDALDALLILKYWAGIVTSFPKAQPSIAGPAGIH